MTGLSAMTDSALDDDAKEIAVRRAGFSLIAASFGISWRLSLALAVAALPIFLADAMGLVSRDKVFGLMLRLDYIVTVSVVAIVLAEFVRRTIPSPRATNQNNRYSATDRFFHVIAFASPAVLKAASWVEDRLIATPTQVPSAPPIFITSLARGGTTALLNALHDVPGVATHTYRDMPLLTAPSLWNRLAGGQKRNVDRHQRAHGDGLEIDLDSPEALEEIVWKMFWPERFQHPTIPLWRREDRKLEAEEFLSQHMAKIIRARLKTKETNTQIARYCSKNNTNIARIPYLCEAFPDCRIVVPVRRPESHAASLLRQHQNFIKQQAADPFIARYMRDIGHYEFGLIHKPIQFPGFAEDRFDPASGDYWLAYWLHAFREILKHSDRCIFVLQDDLRASPQETMMTLCQELQLNSGAMQFTDYFRASIDLSPTDLYSAEIYEDAAKVYEDIVLIARGF
ncbi:sulfotransferase [Zhongshania sp.]|uniref:sulfotransferase n=1 Tax=Zhongshania sp. TaxID=1971902 RepID=UPI0039E5D35E